MQKRCAYLCHFQLVGAFTNRLRLDTLHAAGTGATSAQPVPGPTPVANGSIFQSAQPINYGYQPLFEDRRPRNIGDTLTIVLQENVSASKSSSANASRDGKTNFGFDTVPRYLQGLFGNARADVEASGGNTFNGKGGANASNTFSGTLTVTVDRYWSTAICMWWVKNRSPLIRVPNLFASLAWLIHALSAAAIPYRLLRWRMRVLNT